MSRPRQNIVRPSFGMNVCIIRAACFSAVSQVATIQYHNLAVDYPPAGSANISSNMDSNVDLKGRLFSGPRAPHFSGKFVSSDRHYNTCFDSKCENMKQ